MSFSMLVGALLAAAPVSAADAADLRCFAVFSAMAGDAPEDQAGMTGAIMFYLGRIEGRSGRIDLTAAVNQAFADLQVSEARTTAEAERCGNEMVAKGEEVQRLGEAIEDPAENQPGKR